MNATFNTAGDLVITPNNSTEAMAIRVWNEIVQRPVAIDMSKYKQIMSIDLTARKDARHE